MFLASIPTTLQQLYGEYSSLLAYYEKLNALGLVGLAAIVWAAIVLVMLLILKFFK